MESDNTISAWPALVLRRARRRVARRQGRRRLTFAVTCVAALVVAMVAGHVLRTVTQVGDSLPLQQIRLEVALGAHLHDLDRLHQAVTAARTATATPGELKTLLKAARTVADGYGDVLLLADLTGADRLLLLSEQITALVEDVFLLSAGGLPVDREAAGHLLRRIGAIEDAVSKMHRATNDIAVDTLERQRADLASLEIWIVISLLLLLAAVLAILAMMRRAHRDEDRLRASHSAAKSANAAKTRFLASMSHELRTPLNAIIGFSEAMQMKLFGPLGDARYGEYAEHIHDSGHHLLSLINDVLDLSKIESGRLELASEDLAPDQLIADVLTLMSGRAQSAGVRLRDALPADLPRIEADPRAMRQILINLVGNAIKFTPSGGSVTVGGRLTGEGALELHVRDTGCGIGPSDLTRVLRPFEQADNRLNEGTGTGLGLPICSQLAALHGGELRLESEPGTGTIVRLILPASRVLGVPAWAENKREAAG